MTSQEPPFTLEARTEQYDIRTYGPMLVAETRIEAGFKDAGNRGFKILADYIFGNNQSRTMLPQAPSRDMRSPSEKVAMTAPVNQVQSPWGFLIQFTMPASFTLTTLPKPNDGRVHLRELPARRMAVSRYSGSWSEASYQKHRRALVSSLKHDGIQATGEPVFARFNSPFRPWFLRRNEIWIEVAH